MPSETMPDAQLETKPRLKRSKAKISLSELTDETKLEVAAVVKKTQVLGNRANANGNKEVKPLASNSKENQNQSSSDSVKPENKLGLGVSMNKPKPKVDVGRSVYDEDKENGGGVPVKRTRQVRKVVPVLLDDSYRQSDDGEDSDEVRVPSCDCRDGTFLTADISICIIVHARGGQTTQTKDRGSGLI